MTTSPARRLAAVPPQCALCPDTTPAVPGPTVTLRPAVGAPRQVGLCALCRRNRPGRRGDELLAADRAWRILHHDASGLLARYRAGDWLPPVGLPEFAGDVARLAWMSDTMRAVTRTAPQIAWDTGLVTLIEHAIAVLEDVPADDQALLPLRQLIDALAHAHAR